MLTHTKQRSSPGRWMGLLTRVGETAVVIQPFGLSHTWVENVCGVRVSACLEDVLSELCENTYLTDVNLSDALTASLGQVGRYGGKGGHCTFQSKFAREARKGRLLLFVESQRARMLRTHGPSGQPQFTHPLKGILPSLSFHCVTCTNTLRGNDVLRLLTAKHTVITTFKQGAPVRSHVIHSLRSVSMFSCFLMFLLWLLVTLFCC